MSERMSSESFYDGDLVFDISKIDSSSSSASEKVDPLCSLDSRIEKSIVYSSSESECESSKTKCDTIKSLWSDVDDISYQSCKSQKILPSDVGPFVESNGVVCYNYKRGVNNSTPLVIGSSKLSGVDGKKGYQASHLVFDPKRATLACGYDVDNKWAHLPNFSLIAGLGNKSELDGSLISGAHNEINLGCLKGIKNDNGKIIPPSCSILGGDNNTIINSSLDVGPSAVIACSGVSCEDCHQTVFLGLKSTEHLKGYNESVFVRDIYALGNASVGPLRVDGDNKEGVLDVNGSAWIEQNLNVGENINGESATFNKVVSSNATFRNLSVSNLNHNSEYVSGNSGAQDNVVQFTVLPGDGLDVIYSNPNSGNIYVNLGSYSNNNFENNRIITIKDVTLEFTTGSSYNVYIWVPPNTRIENYNSGSLTSSPGGAYILNSNGGSVTLRYFVSGLPGSLPTWVIESQFIGNPRAVSSNGFKFLPATETIRTRIIRQN